MKKFIIRVIAFILMITFLSVDFAPALTVSAAPAETVSEVVSEEEEIVLPEEESETEESTEEISETEEPTEEVSSEPESVSEEPESEDVASEEVSEEVSDESEETASEEDAETSEEATDDTSEEESEEPANEEFTGPLVIVNSVDEMDEGLAEGRNVGVAIDEKNFPDEGFREYIEEKYDRYPCDGILGAKEIKDISSIDVSNNTAMKDLKGIEFFRYLTYLKCENIGLTSLDISLNNKLESLDCTRNSIAELDTTYNIRLQQLDCSINDLAELNLSNNVNLVFLDCTYNELTELNLSKNTLLITLYCNTNSLKSLDLSKNHLIENVDCSSNEISTLNVSKCKNLTKLYCSYNYNIKSLNVKNCTRLSRLSVRSNKISSLDISKCIELEQLICSKNELTSINLQNNKKLEYIDLADNRLTELDVSKNILLESLWLSSNSLTKLDVSENSFLRELYVSDNYLEEMDSSQNVNLRTLSIIGNRLSSLVVLDSVRLEGVDTWNSNYYSSTYFLELDEKGTFDVTSLPGDFDVNRIVPDSIEGATLNGTVMTVTDKREPYITYLYQCNSTTQLKFTIKLNKTDIRVTNYEKSYYTGNECSPSFVIVEYNGCSLKKGTDYSLSYENNIQKYESSKDGEQPKIIVKGKGNYSFVKKVAFNIYPLDLSGNAEEQNLELSDIELAYTGKVQKVKPVVYSSGKKIPEKDIEYVYPDTAEGAYKEPGEYKVLVKGKSENVIGEYAVTLKINPKNLSAKSVSKVKIKTDLKSYPYNKETGTTYPNEVTVTDGKTVLTEGKDYTLSYSNHKKVGTATITVTGINGYTGTKKATYKITGKKLTSKMVTVLQTLNYEDDAYIDLWEGKDYTVKSGDTVLEEGIDFVCVYPKSGVKPGNYKVTFKGIGEYTGSVTKTFKVNKVSLANRVVTLSTTTYTYSSNGVKPVPKVWGLTEGRDYTVVYVNNKNAAGAEDAKAPYLYIKGKGGYTGTTKANPVKFTIEKAPLESLVTLKADNILYKDKNNNYVTKFTLTERTTGKKLAKGKDYDKVKYEYKLNGTYTEISSGKCPAEATALRITVYASENGNYSGSISTEYSFYTKQISKAKVQAIAAREYNGQQVRPLPVVTMTVKNNGKTETVTLIRGRDYVLEYGANNKVGTGTVIIKGIGDYGGSKTVKFKISKKVIK